MPTLIQRPAEELKQEMVLKLVNMIMVILEMHEKVD